MNGAPDGRARASGELPILSTSLRLGELVATLALAQDNAFGQPLESQLRSCLLASWISGEAGLPQGERDTIYWVALLRYVGCTGHAHEVATVFGDEIGIRAQTLVHDAANPAEVIRDVIAFATAGRSNDERDQIIAMIQQTAQQWAIHNFSSGCEVADMLVQRLAFSQDVRDALRFTFERWNGNGYPAHAKGEAIPRAMRVVHLSHDMEAVGRIFSPAKASKPPASVVAAPTTRCWPIYSWRMDNVGSTCSRPSIPGTLCLRSSRRRTACCTVRRWTRR